MSALRSLSRQGNNKPIGIKKEKKRINKLSNLYFYDMESAKNKGMTDGRVISGCVIMEILHRQYQFNQKQLEKLMQYANEKNKKLKEEVTNFIVNYWCKRLETKLLAESRKKYVMNEKEKAYYTKLYEYYCSGCAVMFSSLVDLYNFSSNSKGTGKLDFLMEWCVNRYIELQMRTEGNLAKYYVERLNRKAGTSFRID